MASIANCNKLPEATPKKTLPFDNNSNQPGMLGYLPFSNPYPMFWTKRYGKHIWYMELVYNNHFLPVFLKQTYGYSFYSLLYIYILMPFIVVFYVWIGNQQRTDNSLPNIIGRKLYRFGDIWNMLGLIGSVGPPPNVQRPNHFVSIVNISSSVFQTSSHQSWLTLLKLKQTTYYIFNQTHTHTKYIIAKNTQHLYYSNS